MENNCSVDSVQLFYIFWSFSAKLQPGLTKFQLHQRRTVSPSEPTHYSLRTINRTVGKRQRCGESTSPGSNGSSRSPSSSSTSATPCASPCRWVKPQWASIAEKEQNTWFHLMMAPRTSLAWLPSKVKISRRIMITNRCSLTLSRIRTQNFYIPRKVQWSFSFQVPLFACVYHLPSVVYKLERS